MGGGGSDGEMEALLVDRLFREVVAVEGGQEKDADSAVIYANGTRLNAEDQARVVKRLVFQFGVAEGVGRYFLLFSEIHDSTDGYIVYSNGGLRRVFSTRLRRGGESGARLVRRSIVCHGDNGSADKIKEMNIIDEVRACVENGDGENDDERERERVWELHYYTGSPSSQVL
jgi:hypothetical protein